MEYACDRHNLICISAEYRQSGYDFDPIGGSGSLVPYDTSFYQVFDVLGALRSVLTLYPAVNRRRIYHYGGSQGGHIALLSAIFAPGTFAFVYASCPMTHVDDDREQEAGRSFSSWEMMIRDVPLHAGRIRCPVYLEHGTADISVPHTAHTQALASELKKHGVSVTERYYENAGHDLRPTTDKLTAFIVMGSEQHLFGMENQSPDVFLSGGHIRIPCGGSCLHIDWTKPPADRAMFRWEHGNTK